VEAEPRPTGRAQVEVAECARRGAGCPTAVAPHLPYHVPARTVARSSHLLARRGNLKSTMPPELPPELMCAILSYVDFSDTMARVSVEVCVGMDGDLPDASPGPRLIGTRVGASLHCCVAHGFVPYDHPSRLETLCAGEIDDCDLYDFYFGEGPPAEVVTSYQGRLCINVDARWLPRDHPWIGSDGLHDVMQIGRASECALVRVLSLNRHIRVPVRVWFPWIVDDLSRRTFYTDDFFMRWDLYFLPPRV